jgi:hypothetical protein
MMKKILMCGCVASVIVLASFSSVIGFQKTEFKTIQVSPLFNIRTDRAIKTEKQEEVTNSYVGKGRESTLTFNMIQKNEIMTHNVIEKIAKMSDEEFNRLIVLVKDKLSKNKIKDFDNIVVMLYSFRGANEFNLDIQEKNDEILAETPQSTDTYCPEYTYITGCGGITHRGSTCLFICDLIYGFLSIIILIQFLFTIQFPFNGVDCIWDP